MYYPQHVEVKVDFLFLRKARVQSHITQVQLGSVHSKAIAVMQNLCTVANSCVPILVKLCLCLFLSVVVLVLSRFLA